MAFRMKQNGAGLASVCILATMVLVMISSTTCLYFGEEDAVRTRCPNDMKVEFVFWDDETTDASAADTDAVRALVLAEAADAGVEPTDFQENFTVYPKSGNARYICTFDTAADDDAQTALWRALLRRFGTDEAKEQYGYARFFCDSRAVERGDFYGTFGGLFFLGILLSAVFICAAVLILYYKQITEAAEDASRFAIMQKVGMTAREIRRSVNSQMLTVFFLPLAFAGLHLACAFPMIEKLLTLFSLYNTALFAATTGISFAVFAALYALVWRVTSRAYCDIVGGAHNT